LTEATTTPCKSGAFFDASDWTPAFDLHPDRKIISVDSDRDFNILGMKMWPADVVKSGDLATGQDEASNRFAVAQATFEAIAQMNGADLVLISAFQTFSTHRDDADLFGFACQHCPDGGVCGDERGRIETVGSRCRCYHALSTRACSLDNRLAAEIDAADLKGGISEIELLRRATTNLTHADLSYACVAESEGFLDRADHDDAGRPVGERHRRCRKRAKNVDDSDYAGRLCRTFKKTVDRDVHWPAASIASVQK
jgi:hypothetical protein